MEPGDARVGDAVSSLSALLRHADARVADAALRCFASLADRFARAHADPAPLAEHGDDSLLISITRLTHHRSFIQYRLSLCSTQRWRQGYNVNVIMLCFSVLRL
jgi:hypothetical protein